MEIYIAQQTGAFIQACMLGVALGVLYDCFRILRIAFRTPVMIVMIQDILFFLLCAAVTFLFMLSVNDGQVRIFIMIGELIGALVEHLTVGAAIMKLSKAMIHFIKSVIHFIFRIIIRPIFRLLLLILTVLFIKPIKKTGFFIKKVGQNAKFRLKQRRLLLYNLYTAKKARVRRKRSEKRNECPDER